MADKKEKYKDFDWRSEDKKLKTTATEKVKEKKKEKEKEKKRKPISPEADKLYSLYKNKMSNRPRRNKYSDKRKKFMSRFASIESI